MNKQKQTILFSIIAASLLFFIVGNINLTIQIEKIKKQLDGRANRFFGIKVEF